jgi:hypothetical protein
MKKLNKDNIFYIIMFAIIFALGGYIYYLNNKTTNTMCSIETHQEGLYKQIFYDQEIAKLKQEKKELYDSIKTFKDEITYLAQFKYSKKYDVDTVWIPKQDIDTLKKDTTVKVFEYSNEKTDSLNYNLKIGSTVEPNWYSLNIDVSDNLTLINKNVNGVNETTIKSDNNANINDVTLFNKSRKKNFWQHFSTGPSVMMGYDITNKNVGVMVGWSVTYSIW